MAKITFKIKHGLKLEGKPQLEVTLREPDAGMIRESRVASERLMNTKEGPILVPSPSLARTELLRRQILKVGGIPGPIPEGIFDQLSGVDLALIEAEAIKLDEAAFKEVTQRGRDPEAG